jgi:hypothetical protein
MNSGVRVSPSVTGGAVIRVGSRSVTGSDGGGRHRVDGESGPM